MTGAVRGWCPGAHRPMRSGDGLVLRVRPRMGRLSAAQVTALCDLAERFGNGMVQLTNRANLQIRGLADTDHPSVLEALAALDLLDADAEMEARRNVIVAPDWVAGDLTARLAARLADALADLPALPGKIGHAVDCGPAPVLGDAPADFRFERGGEAPLILRADGAAGGLAVNEESTIPALAAMMDWLVRHRTEAARRMRDLAALLPAEWTASAALPPRARPEPGPGADGLWLGLPFGMIAAADLRAEAESATEFRVSPWRMIRRDGPSRPATEAVIATPNDPRAGVDACPGAPFCASAEIETRALATALAPRLGPGLHVSGCAKGCARPRPAPLTLVGRAGRIDLVRDGAPWDAPARTGLTPDALIRETS